MASMQETVADWTPLDAPEHVDSSREQRFTGKARLVASLIGVVVGAAMLMTTYGGNTGVFVTEATKPEFLQKEHAEVVESPSQLVQKPNIADLNELSASCHVENVRQLEREATRIDCPSSSLSGDVKGLPRGATFIDLDTSGLFRGGLTGDVRDLPRGATFIDLAWSGYHGGGLTGDVKDLPRGVIYVDLHWSTLTGILADMPKGSKSCYFKHVPFSCDDLRDVGLCKWGCYVRSADRWHVR